MNRIGYEAQEKKLRAKMEELLGHQRDQEALRIESAADPFDQIQAAGERDLLVGLLNRDAQLRDDLRHAFEALNKGTYGVCEDCEEEISPARLKAIPWARRCVACQELSDRSTGELTVLPEAA